MENKQTTENMETPRWAIFDYGRMELEWNCFNIGIADAETLKTYQAFIGADHLKPSLATLLRKMADGIEKRRNRLLLARFKLDALKKEMSWEKQRRNGRKSENGRKDSSSEQ